MESFLSISEVAQRTGLSAHTLRYYERIGLLETVYRASGGQRRYAASDLDWIGFLIRLRATNMSIQDMKAFAILRSKGDATVRDRRELLERHLSDVQEHLQSLQQAAQVLQDKIRHYRQIEAPPSSANTLKEGAHDVPQPIRTRSGQTARNRR